MQNFCEPSNKYLLATSYEIMRDQSVFSDLITINYTEKHERITSDSSLYWPSVPTTTIWKILKIETFFRPLHLNFHQNFTEIENVMKTHWRHWKRKGCTSAASLELSSLPTKHKLIRMSTLNHRQSHICQVLTWWASAKVLLSLSCNWKATVVEAGKSFARKRWQFCREFLAFSFRWKRCL